MATIPKTRLAKIQQRLQAKRAERNQRYVRPMNDLEMKNRLILMMNDPDPSCRISFKAKFPERYVQLEKIFKEPGCPT